MTFIKKLFLTFVLYSSICMAQKDSLTLTLEFLPNKTYTTTSTRSIFMEVQLPEIKKPKITQKKEDLQSVITTGKSINNSFSFSYKSTNETIPSLNNMEFKGFCKSGEYPKLSYTVPAYPNMEEEKLLLTAIQEGLKQIPILSKKLKIDDFFTTSTPFKIPLGTIILEMKILTRYTLKEIKENHAYFDYAQNYILNMVNETNSITGKGNGKGKVTYDIDKHFFTSNQSESSIEMGTKMGDTSLILKMKMDITENTDIENNFILPEPKKYVETPRD